MSFTEEEREMNVLLASIHQVFAGISKPDVTASGREGDLEIEGINRYIGPYTWQYLPEFEMKNEPRPFAFLTNEAFRYYLPAYMSYCLRRQREVDLGTGSSIIFFLCPPQDPRFEIDYKERIGMFSEKEREVIRMFEKFLIKYRELEDDEVGPSQLFKELGTA